MWLSWECKYLSRRWRLLFLRGFFDVACREPGGEFAGVVGVFVFYDAVEDADEDHAFAVIGAEMKGGLDVARVRNRVYSSIISMSFFNRRLTIWLLSTSFSTDNF